MRKRKLPLLMLGMFACSAIAAGSAFAQGPQPWDAASGDWNTDANWQLFVVPDGPGFGDTALIGNGGTAMLTGPAANPVGGVAVGPGALELTSGGSLSVVDATNKHPDATGFFGLSGNGQLTLKDNASLTVQGTVNLNGRTNVTGSGVTLSTQGDLNFGLSSVYNANINSATTYSKFTANNSATLRGTLNVSFSGVSPAVGNSWTLVDAPTINGNFGSVNAVGLAPGRGVVVNKVSGGLGTQAKATVEQRLVLQVNRQTGATTIANPGGPAAIGIQGYSIQSSIGSLNSANGAWNSLEDQSVANWFETPGSANGIAELNNAVGGSRSVAGSGGQQALGNAFDPQQPFGAASPDDLRFSYRNANGDVKQGQVQYLGLMKANNLVLTIDPTSGNAQIRNASPSTSVDLQGYTLRSADGSLLTSFESSLPNSEWAETAGSSNALGELNFSTASTTLAPGDTFDLTGVFSTSGAQDVEFEFRRKLTGEGDFNGDGQADAADLSGAPTAQNWQTRYGADLDGGDFLAWQRSFGTPVAGGGQIFTGIVQYDGSFPVSASTSAVPEPSSALLLCLAAAALGLTQRRSLGGRSLSL